MKEEMKSVDYLLVLNTRISLTNVEYKGGLEVNTKITHLDKEQKKESKIQAIS